MNILFIVKIVAYIAICIGAGFLFESLAYNGNFCRYVVPFIISIAFGIGLCYIMGEEWYIGIGGAALMLIIGSAIGFSLFGEKNNAFRMAVLIASAVIVVLKLAVVDLAIMSIAEKNDPRIAELNETINCYRGSFHLEGYNFNSQKETKFSVEDYPRPYYFSYSDASKNSDNSTYIGLDSIDFPCIPTKENLGEIKTLVYAVKHNTSGALYDRYVNGVKSGEKTFYNSDISFLIINLDTKECYEISNAIFGFGAKYDQNQKKIGKSTAENYIENLYKRYERRNYR